MIINKLIKVLSWKVLKLKQGERVRPVGGKHGQGCNFVFLLFLKSHFTEV